MLWEDMNVGAALLLSCFPYLYLKWKFSEEEIKQYSLGSIAGRKQSHDSSHHLTAELK
jgi:hypothetical protein